MELFRLSAALLAIGCALLAVASLGGIASDRLDILTHLAPFFLAGGALAVLLQLPFGPGRDRVAIACGLTAVLIGVLLIGPEMVARWRQGSAPLGAQTIKVVQINLWGGNVDPKGTALWIARQDADVVVVEEAIRSAVGVPGLLASAYPYRSPATAPFPCTTFILSKIPPTDGGAWVSPDSDGRHSGAWATFGDGDAAFTVVGIHALWPFPPGPQHVQSDLLAARLALYDGRGLIVAGDFNSTPWSFSLRRLAGRLGLERRTHAFFTWPVRAYSRYRFWTPVPLMPIDHILAGPAWRTVKVWRGPRLGSDHLPVVAVLTR